MTDKMAAFLPKLLEDGRLDPTLLNAKGQTPFEIATKSNETHKIVACLLKSPLIDVNALCKGEYPLLKAARCSRGEVVKAMLRDPKTNVNILDAQGNHLLHLACHKSPVTMRAVVRNASGLDFSVKNASGDPPLHYAIKLGFERTATEMFHMAPAAAKNETNSRGETPLQLAIAAEFENFTDISRNWSQGSFDMSVRDSNGDLPVHQAIKTGNVRVAENLVRGTPVTLLREPDGDGATCLQLAAARGMPTVSAILCLLFSEITIRDNE
jgi:ankyrin repeat protein